MRAPPAEITQLCNEFVVLAHKTESFRMKELFSDTDVKPIIIGGVVIIKAVGDRFGPGHKDDVVISTLGTGVDVIMPPVST